MNSEYIYVYSHGLVMPALDDYTDGTFDLHCSCNLVALYSVISFPKVGLNYTVKATFFC